MAEVFEPDIGTRAFWYRLSDNERQRDSLAQSGRANPWISFSEAREFYQEALVIPADAKSATISCQQMTCPYTMPNVTTANNGFVVSVPNDDNTAFLAA